MKRKDFIKLLAISPIAAAAMNLKDNLSHFPATPPMPVLFLGHGSPMNAIEENEFVAGWRNATKSIPRPNAIICISAHWETRGTFITAMEKPKTIHDFGGFPQALFDVQYPAPGSPELAKETLEILAPNPAGLDQTWGLDHGSWSVLKQIYPKADIPVIQISLDHTKNPKAHFELAKELASLREKGVLIVGSGNMVHNLGALDWRNPNAGFDWANEANEGMKNMIREENFQPLFSIQQAGIAYSNAVPTLEHYLPLLYILALKGKNEGISFFNDKTVMGSISMTSVKIG